LFNRANGLISNVALVWSETAQSFVAAYTNSSGATDTNVAATSYANITVGNVYANAFFYSNGTQFIGGSVGSSTYSNVNVAAYLSGTVSVGNLSSASNVTATSLVGTHYGNVSGTTNGNMYVTGNILPSANVQYDLGAPNARFRTLWLSGNTIELDAASITSFDGGIILTGGTNATLTIDANTNISTAAIDANIGSLSTAVNNLSVSIGNVSNLSGLANISSGKTFVIGTRVSNVAVPISIYNTISINTRTGNILVYAS
jgi:hypothetical protein